MAKNTEEFPPRLCKCEKPEKDFSFKACKDCWKCKTCGIYGGCTNIKKWTDTLFGGDR